MRKRGESTSSLRLLVYVEANFAAKPRDFEETIYSNRVGGWGGIRTPGTLASTPVFKTGALNHSATHPKRRGVRHS